MIKLLETLNNDYSDSWGEIISKYYQKYPKSIQDNPLKFIKWLFKNYPAPKK